MKPTMKPKLGVALTKCFFCLGPGDIAINRNLNPTDAAKVEELDGMVVNMDPCSECAGYMKLGIILITIDNSKSRVGWNKDRIPNPYRSGGWFVVKEEAVQRMFTDAPGNDAISFAITNRWQFIEHDVAEAAGLFDHGLQQKPGA